MVMRSSPLRTKVQALTYLWSLMARILYDTSVRKKRKSKNLVDSLLKVVSV